jgi:hypothetical protein
MAVLNTTTNRVPKYLSPNLENAAIFKANMAGFNKQTSGISGLSPAARALSRAP